MSWICSGQGTNNHCSLYGSLTKNQIPPSVQCTRRFYLRSLTPFSCQPTTESLAKMEPCLIQPLCAALPLTRSPSPTSQKTKNGRRG